DKIQITNKKQETIEDKENTIREKTSSIQLYRTGDLCRWMPDGNIEFLGRIDHQVKVRGFRIELGEIENRLLTHPEIKETVVLARQSKDGNILCAYYVIEGNQQPAFGTGGRGELRVGPSETAIRTYLTQYLPDYMLPAYFVKLEKIPLTLNGKIDRKALAQIQISILKTQTHIAPRNKAEKTMAEIWAGILGIPREEIGIDDNFFEIGGHSLRATVMVSKIHKEFNVKLSLAEIFKTPLIRTLADKIEGLGESKFDTLVPIEKKEYYPLSSAQKRMYILQQMDLNSTAYNMPLILPMGKEIETIRLEATIRGLIDRHESLRTTFEYLGEEPVQRIHDRIDFDIAYFDDPQKAAPTIQTPDAKTGADTAGRIINTFVKPFELSRPPLIRSGLIKHADGNHTWLVDIHHIVSDGTSQMILTEDFHSIYNGKELPPLKLQYKDFCRWQNRLNASGEIKNQEEYWLDLYPRGEEIPRLNLLADYKRPEVFTNAGANYTFTMGSRETAGFKALAADSGGTLYMNILAILNTLFYKYTGQTDIVIGSGIAGRPRADLQQIVGMFINTLAMRNFPRGEKNYRTFFSEVIHRSIRAFENQEVQFETLVDKLEPQRDLSRNPIFDISMVVQNFGTTGRGEETRDDREMEHRENGTKTAALTSVKTTAKFDLTFFINPSPEEIQIKIEYYTAIFKPGTIQRLAAHFMNIVNAVVENPAAALDEISMITENEKHRLLYEFNDTALEYPAGKTIHQLFEEQVEKTPDRISTVGSRQYAVGKKKIKDKEIKDNKKTQKQLPQMEATPSFPSFPSFSSTPSTHETPLQEPQSRQVTAVTYRELNEKSNRLAVYLQSKGVGPGTIVAIMPGRSIEMIIGMLGILKTGAAYLPVDPRYPKERINYILADSNAKIVLKEIKELQELNELKAPKELKKLKEFDEFGELGEDIEIIDIHTIYKSVSSTAPSYPGTNNQPSPSFPNNRYPITNNQSPAYIIYTSGTTGRPKGTVIMHRSLVNLCTWHNRYYEVTERDNATQYAGIAFDAAVWEIYPYQVKGATIHILEETTKLEIEKLSNYYRRENIT
ncbi:MAG: AMP-binding protein, partial [bacterium]|nr:AMP-binding protein [bacterium]